MPLHSNEIRSLSAAWIEHHSPEKGTEREATFNAWERLRELVRCDPEDAWTVIQNIRQTAGSDHILANLAAGPVEDLLIAHGEVFIDRIETLARADTQFRKLLGAVWQNKISDKVWSRVKAVAGPPF